MKIKSKMDYLIIIVFVIFVFVVYHFIIKSENFKVQMNNKNVNDELETSPKTIIKNLGTDLNQSDYHVKEKDFEDPFIASNNITYLQNADFSSDIFDRSGYFETITRPIIPPDLKYL